MHQTRKGNQWSFGMNPLKGGKGPHRRRQQDLRGFTLSHGRHGRPAWPVATAAHVHDATVLPDLLHGDEARVWGETRPTKARPMSCGNTPRRPVTSPNRRYRYKGAVNEVERAKNRVKSHIRSRVEHAFGVIKGVFHFTKVRYRGLEKNAHRLFVTCALAPLYLVRRRLLRPLRA